MEDLMTMLFHTRSGGYLLYSWFGAALAMLACWHLVYTPAARTASLIALGIGIGWWGNETIAMVINLHHFSIVWCIQIIVYSLCFGALVAALCMGLRQIAKLVFYQPSPASH